MGGELFGVIARFAFGPSSPGPGIVPAVIVSNESGDGLRIDWDVKKTNTSAPNTATFIVYNLLPTYRSMLAELGSLQGRIKVQLAIGWRGANIPATATKPLTPADVLFTGEDWLVRADEFTGTDVITTIECGDGIQPSDAPPDGGSGAPIAMNLQVGIQLTQMQIPASAGAQSKIAERSAALGLAAVPYVLDHPPREALDLLMASLGLSWGIEGGEFVVYQGGVRDDLLPVVLSPQTGLLKWSVIDDGGVDFEALAQPRVMPGCALNMTDHLGVVIGGAPQLRVEQVQFRGSTEGVSLMTGIARKLEVF